ncbi:type II toxin-antitoxin system HicA family toxin [Duganella phyllosphaerae]|nr:type II toxin-antitoxin system HicA family toxin [Duganella phyllosphaerae]
MLINLLITQHICCIILPLTHIRGCMKYNEFRRWLLKQGAEITPGKGSHHKVLLNGRSTVFPDHGAKEIGTGLVEKIKKDLGLK